MLSAVHALYKEGVEGVRWGSASWQRDLGKMLWNLNDLVTLATTKLFNQADKDEEQ